jgi:hypothetical protein
LAVLKEGLRMQAPQLVQYLKTRRVGRSLQRCSDVFAALCDVDDHLRKIKDDWVKCRIVVDMHKHGVQARRVLTLRDHLGDEALQKAQLAELRRAEERLEAAEKRLEAADNALGKHVCVSRGFGLELQEHVHAVVVDQATSVRSQQKYAEWTSMFILLQKYADAHDGDANPLQSLNSDEYPGLGRWVANQRTAYRNMQELKKGSKLLRGGPRISTDQIAQLKSLKTFKWGDVLPPLPPLPPELKV